MDSRLRGNDGHAISIAVGIARTNQKEKILHRVRLIAIERPSRIVIPAKAGIHAL
jgi:hypothetical protein